VWVLGAHLLVLTPSTLWLQVLGCVVHVAPACTHGITVRNGTCFGDTSEAHVACHSWHDWHGTCAFMTVTRNKPQLNAFFSSKWRCQFGSGAYYGLATDLLRTCYWLATTLYGTGPHDATKHNYSVSNANSTSDYQIRMHTALTWQCMSSSDVHECFTGALQRQHTQVHYYGHRRSTVTWGC